MDTKIRRIYVGERTPLQSDLGGGFLFFFCALGLTLALGMDMDIGVGHWFA